MCPCASILHKLPEKVSVLVHPPAVSVGFLFNGNKLTVSSNSTPHTHTHTDTIADPIHPEDYSLPSPPHPLSSHLPRKESLKFPCNYVHFTLDRGLGGIFSQEFVHLIFLFKSNFVLESTFSTFKIKQSPPGFPNPLAK